MLLKKNRDLKKIVIEQLWYKKNILQSMHRINETQTAETPI